MRLILIFYFLILFILPNELFSQSDYVVTAKGDTLKGKLSFQQIGKVEQVLVRGDKKQTVSSIHVRVALLKGKTYRPIQYAGTVQMMEVMIDGYLSLMAYKPTNVMNYDGRLLYMRDGRMMEIPTLTFKKQMSSFLEDADSLSSKIKEGDLNRKDLDEIIAEYNLFIDSRTVRTQIENQNSAELTEKLKALDEMKVGVEGSALDSKQDILGMLAELKEKISNNKSIPPYLINALKDKLQSQLTLIDKLDALIKL